MTDTTDCWWCAQSLLYVLAMLLVVVALAPAARAAAPEYIVDEQPAPASIEDERARTVKYNEGARASALPHVQAP